ncbi:MAG: beta-ketoacyl synthase N-terminal-like domain-containing protein, partial [bacterium]
SQVAMELGLKGMNTTPTHGEVSFEIALLQGVGELAGGRADVAVVGAADELNHFHLAAGLRWGWWDAGSTACAPFAAGDAGRRRALQGEGAAMFALARPDAARPALAYVWGVQLGIAMAPDGSGFDARAEAALIRQTVEQGGATLGDVGLLLTGANGWHVMDARYLAVAEALSKEAGRPVACGAYKQWCGEFHAASALGLLAAIGVVRGDLEAGHFAGPANAGSVPVGAAGRTVVLYTLSVGGERGISCISGQPDSRR